MESEVSPQLPTSGQILGVLVKTMGLGDSRLRSQTARRYFSGRQDKMVKESNRSEIIEAISTALAEMGFESPLQTGHATTSSSGLASVLDWHAEHWDRLRTFLLPRMSRVYPHHLAAVWRTYLRLAAVDLALRVAAYLHLKEASPATLDFLDWASVDRRGIYLNNKRGEAGVSLNIFAESVGVNDNTVEAWMYRGARPSDENLSKIGRVLASDGGTHECERIARDFRMLYWVSEIAGILGKHIGIEAADGIVARLRCYALQAYFVIDDESVAKPRPADLAELVTRGASAPLAQPLLAALDNCESDDEWKEDILAAGSNWIGRVLNVNLQVHEAEVDALIRETDGRVLRDWDVRNPRAYSHYRRFMALRAQGKVKEALGELVKAAELDPQDPANHFTLGLFKGAMGIRNGDETLVREGLEACWIAATLDPNWIVPWTEVGWLLVESGRAMEAVQHLRAVSPEREPLDSHYYAALGVALRGVGHFAASLSAFESSLKLNPNNRSVAVAAAGVAKLADDKIRFNRHKKIARHLGASQELDQHLELWETFKTLFPAEGISQDQDLPIAHLDAAIKQDPANAKLYFARGRAHFLEGEDSKAIADLDSVIRINPSNAAVYLLRGIVNVYMERHADVVSDMSEVLRLSPGNVTAHYYRGIAYGEQGTLDLAIADLDEVTCLDPDHVDAYRARGDCYRYKKEYDRAIADFDSAIRLDPESALAYRGRGAALRMKGELDRAIADYDAALRLDPEDSFAYRFRGDAYLAKKDYGRAVADFNVTLGMNGDDEIAYRGRGNAYLFSGNIELAIGDFNAAVECNPQSALANHGRGVVREVMGDVEGAENDYRRARELGYDDSM